MNAGVLKDWIDDEGRDYECGDEAFILEGSTFHRKKGSVADSSSSSDDGADSDSSDSAVEKSSPLAIEFEITNRCALIALRGITCESPIESAFYASSSASERDSRMLNYFRILAVGSSSEGGLAPTGGFCWSCGGTENILRFDMEELSKKFATVHPLCASCHDNGVDFRTTKSRQARAL